MGKTYEILQKTLSEIEKTPLQESAVLKTAEEVKNILLDIDDSKKTDEREGLLINFAGGKELQNTTFDFDMESLKRHRDDCNQRFHVPYFRGIMPSWKHFNKPVIFVKKIIRKMCRSLIEPMVEMQNDFNASTTNAINSLYNNEVVTQAFVEQQQKVNQLVIELQKGQENSKSEIAKLLVEISELVKKVDKIEATLSNFECKTDRSIEELEGICEEQELQIKSFDERVEKLEVGLEEKLKDELEKIEEKLHILGENMSEYVKEEDVRKLLSTDIIQNPSGGYADIDYFDFETNFRGTQYSIKERLKDYVKYFKKRGTIVDLGCGRGEFLELLDENEFECVGVDTYDAFVEYCNNKGLQAVKEDAVQYIEQLPEQSLAGIFAAQLVEHLPINKLVDLCNESYKKLMPGGVAIFETPNPTNLSIYINSFYMDPTHQNPVHPRTLEYLLKKAGFREIDVVYTEQSKVGYRLPLLNVTGAENLKEFNDGINLLSDVFFGSQDYAVIARK